MNTRQKKNRLLTLVPPWLSPPSVPPFPFLGKMSRFFRRHRYPPMWPLVIKMDVARSGACTMCTCTRRGPSLWSYWTDWSQTNGTRKRAIRVLHLGGGVSKRRGGKKMRSLSYDSQIESD